MVDRSRTTTSQATKRTMTTVPSTITTIRTTNMLGRLAGAGNNRMVVGRVGNKDTTIAQTTTVKKMIVGIKATGVIESGATNGTVDGIKKVKTLSKMCAETPGAPKDNNCRNHSNPILTKAAPKERARAREDCRRMTRPKRRRFTF